MKRAAIPFLVSLLIAGFICFAWDRSRRDPDPLNYAVPVEIEGGGRGRIVDIYGPRYKWALVIYSDRNGVVHQSRMPTNSLRWIIP